MANEQVKFYTVGQVTVLIEDEPGDSNWTGWQKPLETGLYCKRIE
jgi:hypothetical protein